VGRVINPEGVGKERTRLVKSVRLAIRELMKQPQVDDRTRDLAAYIALALEEIAETIDVTVTAWEKRDYWIKADRFRMEWDWSSQLGKKMEKAVLDDDWAVVASTAAQVAQKLKDIDLPQRNKQGEPWVGAWDIMRLKNVTSH
jgi:hypothetical protein